MREYVLEFNENLFKVGVNSRGELAVIYSSGAQVYSSKAVSSIGVLDFSADIDKNGVLHIAVVGNDTLTYVRFTAEQSSTTHLMHLPKNFAICNVLISAGESILLDYCVKSPEGYACIEYCLSEGKWSGKNILTSREELALLCIDKRSGECFLTQKDKKSYMLINAYNPKEQIFSSDFPIHYTQLCSSKPMFVSGGSIFFNGLEIGSGESVYVLDNERIMYKDGQYKIMMYDGTWRFYSSASAPQNAREYIMCTPCENKKIILSKPFPHISQGVEENLSGGIIKEVYHQQRTLFSLQAELKALKARIRKLEDEKGR